MGTGYRSPEAEGERSEVRDALEAFVREGARRMLAAALEEEVTAFLARGRYERGKPYRGYRNGYHAPREITVGVSAVDVRVPRVADVPEAVVPDGFQSQLVKQYQRASETTQRLFAQLYLEGLATGDVEPVFHELVGETTALSANAVVRLKQRWEAEDQAWKARPLGEHRYASLWAGGISLGAGLEQEHSALLCVLGVREDGTKELLAMELGYRESTESWAAVLRERGLQGPLLAIGDGALGLWAALREVFPTTDHQRCWNHRTLNVVDKLPKWLQAEARRRLGATAQAETQADCERLRDTYVADRHAEGQHAAAETLLREWAAFVTFYRYPKEHWVHLRTSNLLESVFSGVRLRTNAAKRLRQRENALYLVWKIVQRLSQHWRPLNGGRNLMMLVLEGCAFQDGVLQPRATQRLSEAA